MKKFILFFILYFILIYPLYATELSILHTSDIHGQIFSIKYEDGDNIGGVSKRVNFFKNYRKNNKNVLIFDSGDYYQGSVIDTIYRAKYSPEYMKVADYDVVTFGNHEFDCGLKTLKKYLNKSQKEYISTNLKFKDIYLANNIKPYKVLNIDGEKILVLSIIAPECICFMNIKDVEILDTEQVLKKYINEIPHNRVILLSHSGIKFDRKIAKNIDGIDLILGGHDHIFAHEKVGETWIFHPGKYGIKVNEIIYDTKNNVAKQNYIVMDENIESDFKIEKKLNRLNNKTEKFLNKNLFYTNEVLDGSEKILKSQTNLGKLVLKSFVDYFENDFDIAFINSKAIRIDEKLTGYIKVRNIYEMLPFDNHVVKLLVDGKSLKKALNRGKIPGRSYLQIYSKINPDNIDENKIYKVVTIDYLYNGGDGYDELKNSKLEKISDKYLRYILLKYLKKIEN